MQKILIIGIIKQLYKDEIINDLQYNAMLKYIRNRI